MPFADLDEVRLHYRFDGPEGATPLVLSNSLGTDLGMWEAQMAALSAQFRVLRYDTRGHGQSSVPPGPYAIAQLGRDVVALLDHLELDRVHFCGLSMGGMTGMWLGVHAPERVGKLALANTAARIAPPDLWNARIDEGRPPAAWRRSPTPCSNAGSRRRSPHASRPSSRRRMKAMMERTPPDGYTACCAAIRDMDQREAVAAITAPTLVIAGTHDAATPPGRRAAISPPRSATRATSSFRPPTCPTSRRRAAFTAALVDFLGD